MLVGHACMYCSQRVSVLQSMYKETVFLDPKCLVSGSVHTVLAVLH